MPRRMDRVQMRVRREIYLAGTMKESRPFETMRSVLGTAAILIATNTAVAQTNPVAKEIDEQECGVPAFCAQTERSINAFLKNGADLHRRAALRQLPWRC